MRGVPIVSLGRIQAADSLKATQAAEGLNVLAQIYGSTRVVHAPNAEEEKTAEADHTDSATGESRRTHLRKYGPRTAGITRRHDRLALPQSTRTDPHIRELVGYHQEIGVGGGLKDAHIIGVDMLEGQSFSESFAASADAELKDELLKRGVHVYLPTVHSPEAAIAAGALGLEIEGSVAGTDFVNDKWEFNQAGSRVYLADRDYAAMPTVKEKWRTNTPDSPNAFFTAPGRAFKTEAQALAAFDELMAIADAEPGTFKKLIYAKLKHSAAGRGVEKYKTKTEFLEWLRDPLVNKAMTSDDPNEGVFIDLSVIPRKGTRHSPNVNLYIADDEVVVIGGSYQVLEGGTKHIGNEGPISEEDMKLLMPHIYNLARWARDNGFRGICGADFIIGQNKEVWGIELNGRFNGSTAGVFLAQELRGPSNPGTSLWHARNKMPVPAGVSLKEYTDYLRSQKLDSRDPDSPNGMFDHQTGGIIVLSLYSAQQGSDWGQILVFAKDKAGLKRYIEIASTMPRELVGSQQPDPDIALPYEAAELDSGGGDEPVVDPEHVDGLVNDIDEEGSLGVAAVAANIDGDGESDATRVALAE